MDRPERCESCGSPESDLVVVRRLYVMPEAWDTPGGVRRGDLEAWCFPCRTLYAHEDPAHAHEDPAHPHEDPAHPHDDPSGP